MANVSIALGDAFRPSSTAPQMLEDMESSQDWKLLAQPGLVHADEAEDCGLISNDDLDSV